MKLETLFDVDDELGFAYRWFLRREKIAIDNFVFFLHYHVTSILYLISCLLVTISMFVMDPIDCISDKSVDEVIDNYCLYHSTYTMSGVLNGSRGGENLIPHPGIAASSVSSRLSNRSTIKYHHYYLWAAPFLAIQAAFFYIPHGIWKSWEGSKVSTILKESESFDPSEPNEASATKSRTQLASYIVSRRHRFYFAKLFICELLNLINAVVQLHILDLFLGFDLLKLDGFELIRESKPFERPEQVEQMFPKVTACSFFSWGPSGNKVNIEALCVLPVNVINEKVFGILFLWITFVLIPTSILAIIYRLVSLLFRKTLLKVHILRDVAIQNDNDIEHLKNNLRIGSWQLLMSAGWNMDSWEFTEIVRELFYIKS